MAEGLLQAGYTVVRGYLRAVYTCSAYMFMLAGYLFEWRPAPGDDKYSSLSFNFIYILSKARHGM
jgi:hypothetical protein